MTLREAVVEATARLSGDAHLVTDARRDAEFLLRHALGLTSAQFLASPDRALTDGERAAYALSISRRMAHEPVQYIVREQEFYGLALRVSPAVLIPRPETEHLVEAVLAHFQARAGESMRIVDVGTGSGAIAISLAVHLPSAEIVATDISREALAVAEGNARRHGVSGRIRFAEADLLAIPIAGAAGFASGQFFDAVVSNPPYIGLAEAGGLHPEVREHEPHAALFAGESGLDIYRRLVPQARAALKSGGLLAMEIGHGQQGAIAELLNGWRGLRFVGDLQGIPRVALAQKSA